MKILELSEIKTLLDDYIKQLDLTKLSDNELNKLCLYKISKLNIQGDKKLMFLHIILEFPLSRKHALVAIKKLKGKLFIPYIYRHILKVAYNNNVPKPVIDRYILSKKRYDEIIRKDNKKEDILLIYKNNLEEDFLLLYKCTDVMIKRNNTRREKIYNILSKKDGD